MLDMDFGDSPNTLKENYLDMHEVVHADIVYSDTCDESSDLNTVYLGRTRVTRETKVKAEEQFLISEQGYNMEKLLDDTDSNSARYRCK